MKFEERWRPQYCFFNRTKKTYYENGNTRTSWLSLGPDYGQLPLAHFHTYIYYGFPSKKGFSLFICQSKCWTNRKGDLVDEPLDLVHLLRLCRIRNCDQLVANATENLALATRISRPVASRRLTFSIVSLFWTTAQGIKSKNFTFDFNKKLTSRLVEVFNPHIK